jgi:predicted protein tyrosine phosphatase
MTRLKILFICTSNLTRSVTGEAIAKRAGYAAKSAGTAPHAKVRVSQELIDWADKIFVMCERTDRHLTFLKENFNLTGKQVIDLDLPDFIYTAAHAPDLVADLTKRLEEHLTL